LEATLGTLYVRLFKRNVSLSPSDHQLVACIPNCTEATRQNQQVAACDHVRAIVRAWADRADDSVSGFHEDGKLLAE